jgi:hypothetical protein
MPHAFRRVRSRPRLKSLRNVPADRYRACARRNCGTKTIKNRRPEHRQDYLKPTNHSIRMNSVDTESINFHHRVNAVHCPHISQCTVNLAGAIGIGVATTVPAQPDHQQGFPEMKFWMACHLGGALLSGVVVCMTDSSAPHSPY